MYKFWIEPIDELPAGVIELFTAGAFEELELAAIEGVNFARDCSNKCVVWNAAAPVLVFGVHEDAYPEPWLLLCKEAERSPFIWKHLRKQVWPILKPARTMRLRCRTTDEGLQRFWKFFGFRPVKYGRELSVWEHNVWA